jgi:hypothetical protein
MKENGGSIVYYQPSCSYTYGVVYLDLKDEIGQSQQPFMGHTPACQCMDMDTEFMDASREMIRKFNTEWRGT